jgi:hypothetical protein
MKRKIITVVVCGLLLISGIVMIPKNIDVKAEADGGNGTVGIDVTYIHSVAENLSKIVFNFPKGRSFGTDGERHASYRILDWMQDIGLSNVHLEKITNTTHILTTNVDIISEGIKIGDQRLTDFYISPITNYTSTLEHNFSWNNTDVRIPDGFPWFDRLCNKFSFISNLLEGEENNSLHNYTTYFEFCKEKFEEEYNFNFDTFNTSDPDTYPSFFNGVLPNTTGWSSPYVFIEEDQNFNPNFHLPWRLTLLNPLNPLVVLHDRVVLGIQMLCWQKIYHHLKGLIKFDYHNDTYNMQNMDYNISIIFVNRSIGWPLYNSIEPGEPSDTKVSFWVKEKYNNSVNSSNVIGQISGTDPTKTVIISCLYDCWFNQGAGDSAIGMATVLAISKFMKDHQIKPKCTVKFIAFAGEEKGAPGAQYYSDTHPNETSNLTIIDLNQFGFNQTGPRLQTFFVDTNKLLWIPTLSNIINDTNYCERSGTPYLHFSWSRNGGPSDSGILVDDKHARASILFVKDMNWTLHHRDGHNHNKGDTMNYYDSDDVNATVDMIWNVTKYFTVNPNCSFDGTITYTTKDSQNDPDDDVDTIEADMPIKSILPQDHVRVKAELIQLGHFLPTVTTQQDYVITNTSTHYMIDVTLPPDSNTGYYEMRLKLLNSTERIEDMKILGYGKPNQTEDSPNYMLLHPRGNQPPTKPQGPWGSTTLKVGELGIWGADTTDPNNDLVGEHWYLDYDNHPYIYEDTGLYDPQGLTFLITHRYWNDDTYKIKVKAYDQYSTFLHQYMSGFSNTLEVQVTPYSGINLIDQQIHQNNLFHVVQNQDQTFYGQQAGGQSVRWQWNLDDQTRGSQTTTQNTTHAYIDPGIYNITLNVTDNLTGLIGRTYIHVRVSALDANFNLSAYHGAAANTTIRFYNTSKGVHRISNCTWDFGDGAKSYQSNANHSYYRDGDYNVTLTVKDTQNNSDVDYFIVHIDSYPDSPEIPYVQSPGTIQSGSEATILAEVKATDRNITSIKVNITTPANTSGNYTMANLYDDIYLFTLNNSSLVGWYNFTVWATDTENSTNGSSGSYYLMLPVLTYVPPTPDGGAIVNHSWVKVNVSINDTCNTSAFIDWNRTLKGYWSIDMYNESFIYEGSAYQNDGMFHNGMNASSITTGKYGKGLEFDGMDDYVDLGNDTSLNLGTGDFTFIVWEKSHASSYTNTTVLLSNQPENANWNGYVCGVKNTTFFYTVQNGQATSINGIHDVTDNTWHHIAFVRKGSNISLYVDAAFDTGKTGTVRNVTNNKDACFSFENRTDWYHFDGVLDEPQLYSRALGRDEINASYNNGVYRLCHNFTDLVDGTYEFSAHAIDVNGSQGAAEIRQVTIDTVAPTISTVSASPSPVGFGFNVTINTNVTDTMSGVKNVNATITYPIGSGNNPVTVPMTHISGTLYRYVFSNTWHTGRYNYTIIASDNASNTRTSGGHSFNVSASATMSIATLKDIYGANEYINITDPPNPPANLTVVGRGFTWNTYYNASSGYNILESYQGPVNYQEDNGSWAPINNTLFALMSDHPAYNYGYRTGNTHGLFGVYFKPDLSSNWPVAFTYNRSSDPTISVVRSKLVGIGYLDPQSNWAYHYLQSAQSSQGQTDGNIITYPSAFTGTDVTWSYGNTGLKEAITMSNATKTVLQNHPPSSYGLNDSTSYLVFITKLEYLNLNIYNESGVLSGNVTISDTGIDLRDSSGVFKCGLPLGDAYELCNESVRQKLTYRIVHLNGNTYLLAGLRVADLSAMMFPVVVDPTLTVHSTSSDGYIYKSDTDYTRGQTATTGTVNSSGQFITIGQKKVTGIPVTYYVYRGFVFFNTSALPSNAYLDNATLSLYKKDDYSTTDFSITIQNGQPTYPHSPLQSGDYYKNYYSGNGGTYDTSGFHNGYNNISLTQLSWIVKGGTTKFCLRSNRDINANTPTGNEYVNVYANEKGSGYQPKLVVVYRNQSKIKNTGSLAMKGYLLIQIQYYNSTQGKWLVEKDTINETSPRTINGYAQLALDTIFNGHVRTNNLHHNNSNYRVYAAFRDPVGNILRTNDGKQMVAWWQFTTIGGS